MPKDAEVTMYHEPDLGTYVEEWRDYARKPRGPASLLASPRRASGKG